VKIRIRIKMGEKGMEEGKKMNEGTLTRALGSRRRRRGEDREKEYEKEGEERNEKERTRESSTTRITK
jgi:hypothetical protein